MASRIDQRRLNDGERAAGVGEPKTKAEAINALSELHDGIAAMQSLDDLGSPEANDAAWADMNALLRRYEKIKKKWKL